MKVVSCRDGIGVRRHHVADFSAADHRQQDRRVRDPGLLRDGQRARCHGDYCHVDKYSYRRQDQCSYRQRQQRPDFTDFAHDGLGDGVRRAEFDQHPGQHADRQNAHHGVSDALLATDHQRDGLHQIGTAAQAARQQSCRRPAEPCVRSGRWRRLTPPVPTEWIRLPLLFSPWLMCSQPYPGRRQ